MENEKSKIEINIHGDIYITNVDINNTTYRTTGSNYSKYDIEDRKREELHRRTRDRFYRANAL